MKPNPSHAAFLRHLSAMRDYSVLEVGTLRWGREPTHHKAWMEGWASYTMADIQPGEDVDVVCDAHKMVAVFGEDRFDAFWSSSTWEHLARPWIASQEVLRVLKPGGAFFIQTHQTFPLHGYPNDYFRFSTDALAVCFEGARDVVASYEFPCEVRSPSCNSSDAWLNVCISGRK